MSTSNFRVTLLGTGMPKPSPERFGPCTLVEAGDQKLLFDAGRGATIRLGQLGIPIGRIDALFLTHFHSDHTVGIPDLWLTGWLSGPFGSRSTPLRVIGPTGSETLMRHLQLAYAKDVEIRIADEKLHQGGSVVCVREFARDDVVYESGGLRVIAFEVDHGEAIKPAYGYRIEFEGRAAVISGDTRFNDNVIRHGAGADLLIHEVAIAPPELMGEIRVQRILAHHTSPTEAGMVFSRARPTLAAYTHLVFLGTAHVPPCTVADLTSQTRQTYSGPLVVGEDLMCFDIRENVKVTHAAGPLDGAPSRTG